MSVYTYGKTEILCRWKKHLISIPVMTLKTLMGELGCWERKKAFAAAPMPVNVANTLYITN